MPLLNDIRNVIGSIGAGGTKYLLDLYPGAAAARSCLRLSATYTGPSVRLRRSSDSAELDFTPEEFLSNAETWAGAGDAFIKTEYDQTGNSRHKTMTTTANQPKIISSGTMITKNGVPAPKYDGVNDSLVTGSYVDFSMAFTHIVIAGFAGGSVSTSDNVIMYCIGSSANHLLSFRTGGSYNGIYWRTRDGGPVDTYPSSDLTSQVNAGNIFIAAGIARATDQKFVVNGNVYTNGNSALTAKTGTSHYGKFDYLSGYLNGWILASIDYPSDMTDSIAAVTTYLNSIYGAY